MEAMKAWTKTVRLAGCFKLFGHTAEWDIIQDSEHFTRKRRWY
jgi:hypothetical protein